MQTTAFMSVAENRALIGFDKSTPNGIWYDSVYAPKLSAYLKAYGVWANPATSTRLALDDLKDAEKELFPLYRRLYGMMKSSPLVTNACLEAMGYPSRPSGKYESHPVDRMFIGLSATPVANSVLSVSFENLDTGSSTVPYYLAGAMMYYSVGDEAVFDQTLLSRSLLATRSPHQFVLKPTQRGQIISLAARWQNRRGELGPWSEIISPVIP
jgi:hypothetical protein